MNLQLVIIVVGLLATIATSLWGIHINNNRGDKLEAKIESFRADINQRFDSFQREVNHRFDGLQRDFNQFYLITGRLEGRVDAIEKRPS
jgi:type II secretory pathway pseudopilin PulG